MSNRIKSRRKTMFQKYHFPKYIESVNFIPNFTINDYDKPFLELEFICKKCGKIIKPKQQFSDLNCPDCYDNIRDHSKNKDIGKIYSKEEIKDKFWNKEKKKINNNFTNKEKISIYFPSFKEHVDNLMKEYYWCESYCELAFCLIYNINIEPKCSFCNKKSIFNGNYKKYCKDHNRIEAGKLTSKRNKTTIQSKETREKRSNSLRGQKRTEETKQKISLGQKNSQTYLEKCQKMKEIGSDPKERKRRSERLKKAIEENRFTPCITNSRTHFTTIIDGKKFRSTFEGIFHLYNNVWKQNNYEFEKLRIKYRDENQKERIYIVDFINYNLKQVIEIKPKCYKDNSTVILKEKALLAWCLKNSFKYFMINEDDIFNMFFEMRKENFSHYFLNEFEQKYKRQLC